MMLCANCGKRIYRDMEMDWVHSYPSHSDNRLCKDKKHVAVPVNDDMEKKHIGSNPPLSIPISERTDLTEGQKFTELLKRNGFGEQEEDRKLQATTQIESGVCAPFSCPKCQKQENRYITYQCPICKRKDFTFSDIGKSNHFWAGNKCKGIVSCIHWMPIEHCNELHAEIEQLVEIRNYWQGRANSLRSELEKWESKTKVYAICKCDEQWRDRIEKKFLAFELYHFEEDKEHPSMTIHHSDIRALANVLLGGDKQ